MKFIKGKDLLILLIGLFILQACKKEGDIGLEQQINEEGLYGKLVDTNTIQLFSVKDDSLISSNYVRNQVGEFNDPIFGKTKASVAFHALLPKNNVDFGTGAVLDSIVLVMGYPSNKADRFYGDSTSRIEMKLYQIDDIISKDSTYYSNKNFTLKGSPLGTLNYQPRPDDSITVQNIREDKADTVIKIYPQMRMRLNDAFGNELLSKSGQTDLSSSSAFLAAYKGFYLTSTLISGDGGIMSFDLTNTNRTYIVMYYRVGADTTNFVFNINSNSARINKYEHDYTGTVVQNALSDSTSGNNKVYIQSLGGLRAKMRWPNISNLLDSGNIAINKAELIVQLDPGSNDKYSTINSMAVFGRNTANKEQLLNSASYNSTKKEYRIDLTRTVQMILGKQLEYKELYLEDFSKQIQPRRSVVAGINSLTPIKLRIFYTKLY